MQWEFPKKYVLGEILRMPIMTNFDQLLPILLSNDRFHIEILKGLTRQF